MLIFLMSKMSHACEDHSQAVFISISELLTSHIKRQQLGLPHERFWKLKNFLSVVSENTTTDN